MRAFIHQDSGGLFQRALAQGDVRSKSVVTRSSTTELPSRLDVRRLPVNLRHRSTGFRISSRRTSISEQTPPREPLPQEPTCPISAIDGSSRPRSFSLV